ncbi:hypothetical protein MMC28_004411 [Mycoblastus sanguinarius]|nr:hypothetical protein [Mycoblastus sanguinarius]
MRLFLLPISTRQSLIYCQRLNLQLSKETTYLDRIATKASTTWINWERKESGWQKKVTSYGNELFKRLPYEEWGLKSIPPLSARRRKEEIEGKEEVRIEFPDSLVEADRVQNALQRFGSKEKQGFHSKWMWGSILGMPITAPVMLNDVNKTPDIEYLICPFSTFAFVPGLIGELARGGSAHLEFLLDNKLIKLSPSAILRTAYAEAAMDNTMEELNREVGGISSKSGNRPVPREEGEKMLLSKSNSSLLAESLGVPELAVEIERAVQQVESSMKNKRDLNE